MSHDFLNLSKKQFCILLKVLDNNGLNAVEYHNNLIYYPVNKITGKDSKEVENYLNKNSIIYFKIIIKNLKLLVSRGCDHINRSK